MKYKYVTIEREYGSGGTEIAKELAKKCNISCYGSEILNEISKKFNVSVDKLQEFEENATNSFLYSIYVMGKMSSGEYNFTDNNSNLCFEEQKLIKELAGNGPAIFLGHCASEALSDIKGVLKVFIIGDTESKKTRVINEYGIQEKYVEAVMKKFDKKRSNYYNANTSKKWRDPLNYDVVINSSELGIEGAVNLIKGIIE